MSFEWIDSSAFISPLKSGNIESLDSLNGLFFIAMFTDKFAGGRISNGKLNISEYEPKYDNLLEMRIFCDEYEILWKRCSIGEDFVCRKTIDSKNLCKDCFFDEEQLIDIDSTIENENSIITSIGGGKYTLPLKPGENAVIIRNYVIYSEETGRAFVVDFRILGFSVSEVKNYVTD